MPITKMPVIALSEGVAADENIRNAVYDYEHYNARAPKLGIDEDDEPRGRLPVYVSRLDNALGMTRMTQEGVPFDVTINKRVPEYLTGRVVDHELDHVKSSRVLAKHMDLPYHLATILMESYPEYRRHEYWNKLGRPDKAARVYAQSPYKASLRLAIAIDKIYEGKSGRGYAGFIRDIKKEKSVAAPLERFARQYAARMN